ncbi:MAG: hypothetical protein U0350_30620 [Caldilineaceae bacterium]
MIAHIKEQSRWRLLLAAAMLIFSIGLLCLLIYREYAVLHAYQWRLRWQYIIGGFGVLLPGLLLAAAVWADLMHTLGSQVRFLDHVRYYAISHLGRRLPGTLWYVAGRSYFYKQHNASLTLIATASGIELLISVVSGALVTMLFAVSMFKALPLTSLLSLVLILILGLPFMHPQVIDWILRRMKLPVPQLLRYTELARWLIGYALIWIIGGVVFFLIINAVTALAYIHLPFVIAIWSLVGTLSITVFFYPAILVLPKSV